MARFTTGDNLGGDSGTEDGIIIAENLNTDDSGDSGNSGGGSSIGIDPAFTIDDGGQPRKRRGRQPGGTTAGTGTNKRTSAKTLQLSVDSLTAVLQGIHVTIAVGLKAPEMELEDTEAKNLSQAVVNVLDQFNIVPDPKITAVVGLVMTASAIYGPRAYLISERLAAQKKSRRLKVVE